MIYNRVSILYRFQFITFIYENKKGHVTLTMPFGLALSYVG